MPVHHRLRLLAFPVRTRSGEPSWPDMNLPVPAQGASAHARVFDRAGPDERSQ